MYPGSLARLIENLRKLPGVGEKTAERYAFSIAKMKEEDVVAFVNALNDMKDHLGHCKVCGNISDQEMCPLCSDLSRDHRLIFVVESPKDVIAMEKTGQFHGVYHVLNGLVSPSKGIMPEDINLDSLIDRAADVDEVILATSTTMDGETTAMYLGKVLKEKYPELPVSRIAHGLPTGGLLDYADEMTLSHALSDRRRIN